MTNVRLPKEKHRRLKLLAINKGTSIGHLLEEAVDTILEGKDRRLNIAYQDDPIWNLPKIAFKSKDPLLSQKVDEIVYGVIKK